MKSKLIGVVLGLLLLGISAQARLGMTLKDCTDKYGAPTLSSSRLYPQIYNFKVNDIALAIVFRNDISVRESYSRAEGIEPTEIVALKLASPTADLKDTAQYVLLPTDQTKNLTGVTVTLDIIEDLVADSFSVQINGNPPYPGPKGVTWDTQWMQFGLVMQNNSLVLFNQLWPAPGPDPAGNPLPSVDEWSGSILQLKNNTVPAGTQIVLTLTQSNDGSDFITGVSGKAYDKSGASIGNVVNWSALMQPTFHGGPVTESDLAPLGAFQVVVVGAPGGHAHFTSGMGTITVSCMPDISAQLYWPNPSGGGTGETSNCYYGKVQEGYFQQIAQPFGLPSPKITNAGPYDLDVRANYLVLGTGLLPNSKLTATAIFEIQSTKATVPGNVSLSQEYTSTNPPPSTLPPGLISQNDGSFALSVAPEDVNVLYEPGTLTTTVTDADGNWTRGVIQTNTGSSEVTSTSGLHQ
jgi:hypothetical protein